MVLRMLAVCVVLAAISIPLTNVAADPIWDFTVTYVINDSTADVTIATGGLYTSAIVCDSAWTATSSSIASTLDPTHFVSWSAAYLTGELKIVEQDDNVRNTEVYHCASFELVPVALLSPAAGASNCEPIPIAGGGLVSELVASQTFAGSLNPTVAPTWTMTQASDPGVTMDLCLGGPADATALPFSGRLDGSITDTTAIDNSKPAIRGFSCYYIAGVCWSSGFWEEKWGECRGTPCTQYYWPCAYNYASCTYRMRVEPGNSAVTGALNDVAIGGVYYAVWRS